MAMIVEGNGSPLRAASVQRNSPCPCGSGKKAKNCCGTETKYYHSGPEKPVKKEETK